MGNPLQAHDLILTASCHRAESPVLRSQPEHSRGREHHIHCSLRANLQHRAADEPFRNWLSHWRCLLRRNGLQRLWRPDVRDGHLVLQQRAVCGGQHIRPMRRPLLLLIRSLVPLHAGLRLEPRTPSRLERLNKSSGSHTIGPLIGADHIPPSCLLKQLGQTSGQHSPQVGWMADVCSRVGARTNHP